MNYVIIPDQRFELSNGNRTTIGTLIFASKVQIEILDNCSALRSYLREHVCPKKGTKIRLFLRPIYAARSLDALSDLKKILIAHLAYAIYFLMSA